MLVPVAEVDVVLRRHVSRSPMPFISRNIRATMHDYGIRPFRQQKAEYRRMRSSADQPPRNPASVEHPLLGNEVAKIGLDTLSTVGEIDSLTGIYDVVQAQLVGLQPDQHPPFSENAGYRRQVLNRDRSDEMPYASPSQPSTACIDQHASQRLSLVLRQDHQSETPIHRLLRRQYLGNPLHAEVWILTNTTAERVTDKFMAAPDAERDIPLRVGKDGLEELAITASQKPVCDTLIDVVINTENDIQITQIQITNKKLFHHASRINGTPPSIR